MTWTTVLISVLGVIALLAVIVVISLVSALQVLGGMLNGVVKAFWRR